MSQEFDSEGPKCSNGCECWEWVDWALYMTARALDECRYMSWSERQALARRVQTARSIIDNKREAESQEQG